MSFLRDQSRVDHLWHAMDRDGKGTRNRVELVAAVREPRCGGKITVGTPSATTSTFEGQRH
jgi:hypothetical protein